VLPPRSSAAEILVPSATDVNRILSGSSAVFVEDLADPVLIAADERAVARPVEPLS
jgi:hypothetical protein